MESVVPASLSGDDAVTFLIGLAARWDTTMEASLRRVVRELQSSSGGGRELPLNYERVHKLGLQLTRDSDLSAQDKEIYRQAMIAALAAHKERVRLIHDEWMTYLETPESVPVVWNSMRGEDRGDRPAGPRAREIPDFERCFVELKRCHYRLGALEWINFGLRPPEDDSGDRYREIARGEFDYFNGGLQPWTWRDKLKEKYPN